MGDARVSLRDTLSRDTLLRCTFARHFYVSLTIACATQLCLYTYTFARLFARLLRCTFARHFYNCVAHAIARDTFVQKCFVSFVRLFARDGHNCGHNSDTMAGDASVCDAIVLYIYIYIYICLYTYFYIYVYICANVRRNCATQLCCANISRDAFGRHNRVARAHAYTPTLTKYRLFYRSLVQKRPIIPFIIAGTHGHCICIYMHVYVYPL